MDTIPVTQALGQLQKQMETPTKTEELVELFYKVGGIVYKQICNSKYQRRLEAITCTLVECY